MDPIARLSGAVALLALSGCVSIEPPEPAIAHRSDPGVIEVPGPAGGTDSDEASMAVASDVRSAVEPVEPGRRAAAASAEGAADAAGERRAVRDRRLTLRQKRIFVLGLAAQEKK